MKNFTQKMKSVLFSVLAVLALATPANAEVTGVSDLFGKYKFTAKIEYTEVGKAYEGQFKESSDVTIEKHAVYDGQIIGLAGSLNGQLINGWNAEKSELMITNPSQGGVWGDLYMANAKGDYPWNGILEGHDDAYSTAYAYNAADGSISIPDFTLGKGDYQAETFTVYVKVTNAKLELVELDKVDVADLAGDWHFKAVEGGFNTMEGSTLPVEFDMNLVAKDASKKAYAVSLKLGDFEPVNIDATFNGSVFSLNLDSTCLDKDETIYIVNLSSAEKKPYQEPVTFNYTEGGSLSMSSGMSIVRKDSIAPEKPKAQLQWYMAGVAKRAGGDVTNLTWDGTFKMVANEVYNIEEGANYPKEFDFKVEKGDYGYYVTEIVGCKLQPNAMMLYVDEANPLKAKIGVDYYGMRTLEMVDPGKVYIVLGDQNATVSGDINLTLNEDGTVQMDNIAILRHYFGTEKNPDVLASYVGVKGTKEAAPVAPEFSWAQSFKVTAEVEAYNKDFEYPTEFTMTVVTNEYTGGVMLTEFFGADISQLNYGGAGFTVSDDPMKAAISAGATLKSIETGKLYLVLADQKGQSNPINVTADAEGNLVFDNFAIMLNNYETQEKTAAALYKNVKAVPGAATGIVGVQNHAAKVAVVGNTVKLDKAQSVQVYNVTGKCVFNAVASEVSGLVKGVYLVKTAVGVVKVMVR